MTENVCLSHQSFEENIMEFNVQLHLPHTALAFSSNFGAGLDVK
jgi:hypothetical protein